MEEIKQEMPAQENLINTESEIVLKTGGDDDPLNQSPVIEILKSGKHDAKKEVRSIGADKWK